uniref:AP2/ERF domain-containing protein n=1 Tax=Aegilops tauschii subsp. strangulata TaxID=200361 RepID=A0A453G495_AEGTS
MKHMTRQEFVASLRRKSSGFSRGASIYRGVTRHHQHGRWQARIGRVAGNKDLYLGTFSTQEEAAEAYDIAAIKFRGLNAVTNFDMTRYDVKSILDSTALPIGSAAKRLKDAEAATASSLALQQQQHAGVVSGYDMGALAAYGAAYHHHHPSVAGAVAWPTIAFQAPPQQVSGGGGGHMYHPYAHAQPLRGWCKQEPDHAVIAAAHSLQELHHLNLGAGGGAHDFFSQHAQAMQQQHGGLGSIDNGAGASLEHSTGSNSVVYNNGAPRPRAGGSACPRTRGGCTGVQRRQHEQGSRRREDRLRELPRQHRRSLRWGKDGCVGAGLSSARDKQQRHDRHAALQRLER